MDRHKYRLILSFETGRFEVVCSECGKVIWIESASKAKGDCPGHPPDLGVSVSESIYVKDIPK